MTNIERILSKNIWHVVNDKVVINGNTVYLCTITDNESNNNGGIVLLLPTEIEAING